ncbi:MAG TPA: glutamate racemase, partial [Thiothrix sp.]|nr:glutamate racemase [Thiothrix sp.]
MGIFDSGVGGLSILHEIQALLPHEQLIYIADSANAPYGDKSTLFIQQRSFSLAKFLIAQGCKSLVIACNTATTEAISLLRQQLSIPIIGVEPAIKPAATLSKNKIIGVLATHRTLQSQRVQQLIQHYAQGVTVLTQACPGLMEIVETSHIYTRTDLQLLKSYTQPLLDQHIDTLVLGCTHYPFLLKPIRDIAGEAIPILETGKPVALQLRRMLKQNHHLTQHKGKGKVVFYSSLNTLQNTQTIQRLWQQKVRVKPLPT